MKRFIGLLFVTILLLTSSNFAQNPNGGDQRTESLITVGGLSTIPPYHTDMPLDCLIGYISMDSLARTADVESVLNKPLTTTLDSLRVAARFMYAACDYSPALLMSYMTCTQDSAYSNRFESFPANSYYGLESAIEKRINEFGSNYAILLKTHYVLRIIINSVVVGTDTTYTNPLPWVNVTCQVQQIFKGNYLPTNCNSNLRPQTEPKRLLLGEDYLKFGYPENWMTGIGFNYQRFPNSGTFMNTVSTGEEYYVFLEQVPIWKYSDYLTPTREFEATGGLFRISNGLIEDPSNFWGLGTNPTEQEFLIKLNELISNIKSWWL